MHESAPVAHINPNVAYVHGQTGTRMEQVGMHAYVLKQAETIDSIVHTGL